MHIKILGRPSAQTLTVYWSDPQKCHYEDQLWRLVNAKDNGKCALSRLSIRLGEPVYRPGKRGGLTPANHGAMIAAASLIACDIEAEMENEMADEMKNEMADVVATADVEPQGNY